jgi:hypothetical protein
LRFAAARSTLVAMNETNTQLTNDDPLFIPTQLRIQHSDAIVAEITERVCDGPLRDAVEEAVTESGAVQGGESWEHRFAEQERIADLIVRQLRESAALRAIVTQALRGAAEAPTTP